MKTHMYSIEEAKEAGQFDYLFEDGPPSPSRSPNRKKKKARHPSILGHVAVGRPMSASFVEAVHMALITFVAVANFGFAPFESVFFYLFINHRRPPP